MRTRTTLLAAAAAALVGVGAFTTGLAAADSEDDGGPRGEMHVQMGGGMGMGMHDMAVMQQMHEAVDPAAMDDMHAQMRELLPADLREDADAMHEQMTGSATDATRVHQSHHSNGS